MGQKLTRDLPGLREAFPWEGEASYVTVDEKYKRLIFNAVRSFLRFILLL